MNEVYVGLNKIELPIIHDNNISIKDVSNLHFSYDLPKLNPDNIIAVCDKKNLRYMQSVFSDLKKNIVNSNGSTRLAYMNIYASLVKQLENYSLVKDNIVDVKKNDEVEKEASEDFSFTKPMVDEIETGDVNYQSFVSNTKSSAKSDTLPYKVDSSQKNVSASFDSKKILKHLQEISSEGRIFTDEDRFKDSNLSLSNSISLNKLKTNEELIQRQGTVNKIDISKSKILEMGKVKHDTLKKVCNAFNKRVYELNSNISSLGFNVKNNLLNRYNQINEININSSVIGEMPKALANKIKVGSQRIFNRNINNTQEKNQVLVSQLKSLKETLYENSIEKEEAKVKCTP